MKILILGSNPSSSAKTSTAFCLSTKSGRVLKMWMDSIGANNIYQARANILPKVTDNNRSLSLSEIKECLPNVQSLISRVNPTHIIAVGKTAEKALTLLQAQHFYTLPHPSGLNRQINDAALIREKLKGLSDYLGLSYHENVSSS